MKLTNSEHSRRGLGANACLNGEDGESDDEEEGGLLRERITMLGKLLYMDLTAQAYKMALGKEVEEQYEGRYGHLSR